jgi:hypothetical protein
MLEEPVNFGFQYYWRLEPELTLTKESASSRTEVGIVLIITVF